MVVLACVCVCVCGGGGGGVAISKTKKSSQKPQLKTYQPTKVLAVMLTLLCIGMKQTTSFITDNKVWCQTPAHPTDKKVWCQTPLPRQQSLVSDLPPPPPLHWQQGLVSDIPLPHWQQSLVSDTLPPPPIPTDNKVWCQTPPLPPLLPDPSKMTDGYKYITWGYYNNNNKSTLVQTFFDFLLLFLFCSSLDMKRFVQKHFENFQEKVTRMDH